jgi:hypothetical protein
MGKPTNIRRVPFCLPNSENRSQTMVCQRLSLPLIDQFIFHQSYVRRNSHQLHLNSVFAQAPAQLFTFLHQRVSLMRNFPRQHSLDRTQAISENKTPLRRPYDLSNVSQCSEQNTQPSCENTILSCELMPKSTHTHLINSKAHTTLNQSSKSHTYSKSTTHHIQTSKSIARGAPPMNTSPPEYCQVSSPSTKGVLRSYFEYFPNSKKNSVG